MKEFNWKWKEFDWKGKEFNLKRKEFNWKRKDFRWKWKDTTWKWNGLWISVVPFLACIIFCGVEGGGKSYPHAQKLGRKKRERILVKLVRKKLKTGPWRLEVFKKNKMLISHLNMFSTRFKQFPNVWDENNFSTSEKSPRRPRKN